MVNFAVRCVEGERCPPPQRSKLEGGTMLDNAAKDPKTEDEAQSEEGQEGD